MSKICGKCIYYTETYGDLESSESESYEAQRWGWCVAPVPMTNQEGDDQVYYDDNAKNCECYKKEKVYSTEKVNVLLSSVPCKACGSSIMLTHLDSDLNRDNEKGYCTNPSCKYHKPEKVKQKKRTWHVSFVKE
jgi:hypothetical protein